MCSANVTSGSIRSFSKWNIESCVRSRSHRYKITASDISDSSVKDWFPPAMLPVLQHPVIKSMPSNHQKSLQARYLVHFLNHTTALEHLIINNAVENIIHKRMRVEFEDSMCTIGLMIYTDEAYHALFSDQLAADVAKYFQIERSQSSRLLQLQKLIESL